MITQVPSTYKLDFANTNVSFLITANPEGDGTFSFYAVDNIYQKDVKQFSHHIITLSNSDFSEKYEKVCIRQILDLEFIQDLDNAITSDDFFLNYLKEIDANKLHIENRETYFDPDLQSLELCPLPFETREVLENIHGLLLNIFKGKLNCCTNVLHIQ